MDLTAPAAPKRRPDDGWRAYRFGVTVIVVTVVAHSQGFIDEHAMTLLVALGASRLPAGRLRDGRRWALAQRTRTEERAVPDRTP